MNMIRSALLFSFLFGCAVFATSQQAAAAPPSKEQRAELKALQTEVRKVSSLLRKKEFEEAEKQINSLREKAEKLLAAAQFPATAASLLRRLIATNRQKIAKGLGKPDPTLMSFSKDIAPLIRSKCGRCHGANNPRGGLSLNNFRGFRQGGASKQPLIQPKRARNSMLIARLVTTNTKARMPKGGAALLPDEVQKIALWIDQGALFDGKDETTALADLGKTVGPGAKPKAPVTVVINKATGNEKVSFVNDIAPTIVNLCTRCHGGNNPRAGLSVVNFESLMRGSENGRVIIPGNLNGSKLWRLVGAGDQPRMPQGQARITRKFHADLRVWIEEGARFDGPDAKQALRALVPTDEEKMLERLAALSPEEFRRHREQRTEDQWVRVNRRVTPRFVSSGEFLVYGDASAERLKQIDDWAEAHATQLKSIFGIKAKPIWKGRLAVFVMKDRFGYTEFNKVINNRDTAKSIYGHMNVTLGYEDAYVVLEDIGDDASESSAGMEINLLTQITAAYLDKPGTKLPDWVIQGTGLALGAKSASANPYIDGMQGLALDALKGIQKPDDVFANGNFGPGDVGPVGYTLVKYMIKAGGAPNFGKFIRALQSGSNMPAAVKSVYNADLKALGTGYLQTFK
jgi:negative regulator of replication initiation